MYVDRAMDGHKKIGKQDLSEQMVMRLGVGDFTVRDVWLVRFELSYVLIALVQLDCTLTGAPKDF